MDSLRGRGTSCQGRKVVSKMGNRTNVASTKIKNKSRFFFFQQFLRHPKEIGSVIPSSSYLERRIIEMAEVHSCSTVVELGSGTGGTTRAILRALPKYGRLLSIEINPRFHEITKAIGDSRLIAHHGSAAELGEILAHYGLPAPDAVISGIPFSTMPEELGRLIIRQISENLAPHGRFVAYQFNPKVYHLCTPVMGECKSKLEVLNIPPMRVYRWEKRNGHKACCHRRG